MLDRAHRLRNRGDFTSAVRAGRRTARGTVVVHLRLSPDSRPAPDGQPASADRSGSAEARPGPPRAGFVVSRAVGGAVVRNKVRRRLRHLMRDHLAVLPAGAALVVRALPSAAGASYARLGADLSAAVRSVTASARRQRPVGRAS